MGYSLCFTPSTVPSLRLRCVTSSALAPGTPPVSPRTAKPWFCEVISTCPVARSRDRKSTRLNSSHLVISYAVFCLKKKKKSHLVYYYNVFKVTNDTGEDIF